MRLGNPLPASLPHESFKAARIFKSFVNPTLGMDGLIPPQVLRSAHGFAIFTVAKAGFLMSVRAGTGLVIARLPDGQWSAPSAIGTGGMGIGGQVGAEVTEFILVLNSKSALTQFMSAGSLTLGGNASVALGPIGRNAEGSGALNSKGKIAAMYSYSKTKGAFAGVSVEGSVIVERQDCNVKAYGPGTTATKILSGQIDTPSWAEDLIDILTVRAGSYTEYVDRLRPLRTPSDDEFDHHSSHPPSRMPSDSSSKAYLPQNSDRFENDIDSLPASSDPYSFGSSYPFGSNPSTPKLRPKKNRFTVGSWKFNSRQNTGKSDQSNISRQTHSTPHWTDSLRSDSPPCQSGWSVSAVSNKLELPRSQSQSNVIPEQSVEESLDDYRSPDQRQGHIDHEIRSLSSIGSDDRSDPSNDWAHPKQPDHLITSVALKPSESGKVSKKATNRHWLDSLAENGLSNKPEIADYPPINSDVTDNLMSFDDLATETENLFLSTNPGKPFKDRFGSMNPYQTGIETDLIRKPSNNNHSSSEDGGLHEEPEEGRQDFLVGTCMPSVTRTNTDLAGYLGKVTAKFDFDGDQTGDLSFKKGDVILIIEKIDDQWWLGSIGLRRGIFPINRVSNLQT